MSVLQPWSPTYLDTTGWKNAAVLAVVMVASAWAVCTAVTLILFLSADQRSQTNFNALDVLSLPGLILATALGGRATLAVTGIAEVTMVSPLTSITTLIIIATLLAGVWVVRARLRIPPQVVKPTATGATLIATVFLLLVLAVSDVSMTNLGSGSSSQGMLASLTADVLSAAVPALVVFSLTAWLAVRIGARTEIELRRPSTWRQALTAQRSGVTPVLVRDGADVIAGLTALGLTGLCLGLALLAGHRSSGSDNDVMGFVAVMVLMTPTVIYTVAMMMMGVTFTASIDGGGGFGSAAMNNSASAGFLTGGMPAWTYLSLVLVAAVMALLGVRATLRRAPGTTLWRAYLPTVAWSVVVLTVFAWWSASWGQGWVRYWLFAGAATAHLGVSAPGVLMITTVWFIAAIATSGRVVAWTVPRRPEALARFAGGDLHPQWAEHLVSAIVQRGTWETLPLRTRTNLTAQSASPCATDLPLTQDTTATAAATATTGQAHHTFPTHPSELSVGPAASSAAHQVHTANSTMHTSDTLDVSHLSQHTAELPIAPPVTYPPAIHPPAAVHPPTPPHVKRQRWMLIGMTALLGVLAAIAVQVVNSTHGSPEATVRAYAEALTQKNAEAAIGLLTDEQRTRLDRTYLTPEMLRHPAVLEPISTTRDGDIAKVLTRITVGSVAKEYQYTLKKVSSRFGIVDQWKLEYPLGELIVLGDDTVDLKNATINGAAGSLRGGNNENGYPTVFPGRYDVVVQGAKWRKSVPTTVDVFGTGSEGPVTGDAAKKLSAPVIDGLSDAVKAATTTYLKDCAQQAVANPNHCPNRLYESGATNVSWTLVDGGQPTYEVRGEVVHISFTREPVFRVKAMSPGFFGMAPTPIDREVRASWLRGTLKWDGKDSKTAVMETQSTGW